MSQATRMIIRYELMKIILNELLQAMIDSEATDNYISHEANQLELILQQNKI
jgi:hypothetical protein